MNNIIYDDKIITPENYKWKYYYDFLNRLEQRDCVKFALFCAKIVNNNSKESNLCIELVGKWLIDKNSVNTEKLNNAANAVNVAFAAYSAATYSAATYSADAAADASYASVYATAGTASNAVSAAYYASNASSYAASAASHAASAAYNAAVYATNSSSNVVNINEYLQILLRKTKQFQNNKILEQISKVDVDKLELVDWNMITDIMLEEYNIVHEFEYDNIFSRRCLIELLRREYA